MIALLTVESNFFLLIILKGSCFLLETVQPNLNFLSLIE